MLFVLRVLVALLASTATPVFAQWITQPLPAKTSIVAVMDTDTASGHVLFATSYATNLYTGFYASRDDGATWESLAIPGYPDPGVIWAGSRPTSNGIPSRRGDLYLTLRVPGGNGPLQLCDILRSADLGVTWTLVAAGVFACKLAFDPTEPDRVFALATGEIASWAPFVYRSDNGGVTWQWIDTGLSGSVHSLKVTADGTIYGLGILIMSSRDQGATWKHTPIASVDEVPTIGIDVLSWSPSQDGRVSLMSTNTGLYSTADAGLTWQPSELRGFFLGGMTTADFAPGHESEVIIGYRYGLALKSESGLIPFSNGLPEDAGYGPVGGPYVVSFTGVSKCVDFESCKGGRLPQDATLVEFHNAILDHYFMTVDPVEAAGIDSGSAGPGWKRTGYTYPVYTTLNGTLVDVMPVCRFYGTPGRGPNSHFFTLDAQECAAVQTDPGWMLESPMSFAVATPVARLSFGVITYDCGSRRRVYRLYNNRYAQNDSNHRYTSDEAVYNAMQAQGWIGEGFRFCVP